MAGEQSEDIAFWKLLNGWSGREFGSGPGLRSSIATGSRKPRSRLMAKHDLDEPLRVAVGACNHMCGHELSNADGSVSSRFHSRLARCQVAFADHSDKSGSDSLSRDQADVCRFGHRIGRFNRSDQTFGLNESV